MPDVRREKGGKKIGRGEVAKVMLEKRRREKGRRRIGKGKGGKVMMEKGRKERQERIKQWGQKSD